MSMTFISIAEDLDKMADRLTEFAERTRMGADAFRMLDAAKNISSEQWKQAYDIAQEGLDQLCEELESLVK